MKLALYIYNKFAVTPHLRRSIQRVAPRTEIGSSVLCHQQIIEQIASSPSHSLIFCLFSASVLTIGLIRFLFTFLLRSSKVYYDLSPSSTFPLILSFFLNKNSHTVPTSSKVPRTPSDMKRKCLIRSLESSKRLKFLVGFCLFS